MRRVILVVMMCTPFVSEISARSVGGDIKNFFDKDIPKTATQAWGGLKTGFNAATSAVWSLDLAGKTNALAGAIKQLDQDSGGMGTLAAMIAFPEAAALLNTADQMSASFAAGKDKEGLEVGLNALMSHYTGTNLGQLQQIYADVKKGDPDSITDAVELLADFGSAKAGKAFSDRIKVNPKWQKALSHADTLLKNTWQALAIGQAVYAGNYDLALAEAVMVTAHNPR